MAATLKRRFRADISAADTLIALNHFLFTEQGFTGNTTDYYDPRNSFLNEVLDRKCGIPITLALVFYRNRTSYRIAGAGSYHSPRISWSNARCVKAQLVLDPYAKGVSRVTKRSKHASRASTNGVEPPKSVVAKHADHRQQQGHSGAHVALT